MDYMAESHQVVENLKAFLVKFDFAGVGDDGKLTFTEEQ